MRFQIVMKWWDDSTSSVFSLAYFAPCVWVNISKALVTYKHTVKRSIPQSQI
jgi:hypothetical protein